MQPFKLTLPNGATLTGLSNIPDRSSPAYTAVDDSRRPLLVAIHGGSYSSAYFDADAKHTASLCSNALGVPVVAIDRPLYGGTSSFYPLPEGKTYHEELAGWMHKYILPTLWKEFGRDQGCSSMVLHCHSLATPSAVILAGWDPDVEEGAKGEAPAYPLAGLTISGFGTQVSPMMAAQAKAKGPPPDPSPAPEFLHTPLDAKDEWMLPAGSCDPAIYKQSERLDKPMHRGEIDDYKKIWFPDNWRLLCGHVKVPVMIAMAERDALWVGTDEHVREFAAGFTNSERVDASVLKEAPHCIELSYWAQGWYARCFGWALECAAGYTAKER